MIKWIKWSGGDCPVPSGMVVVYMLRDGCLGVTQANCLNWVHYNSKSDVVMYLVVSEAGTDSEDSETLLDKFAMCALPQLIGKRFSNEEIAIAAYEVARAMMQARKNS